MDIYVSECNFSKQDFFQLPVVQGVFVLHMYVLGAGSLCIILLFPPVFALPEYFVAIAQPISLRNKVFHP